MNLALILILVFSAPTPAKLVKSTTMRSNEKLTAENLPAAKICEGKSRICHNGRKAALVLPTCELVCPEDNRKDVACYQGMIDEADESNSTWVEVPEIPGTPVIYSEGSYRPGVVERGADCEVLELVRSPTFPPGPTGKLRNHDSRKVKTAR